MRFWLWLWLRLCWERMATGRVLFVAEAEAVVVFAAVVGTLPAAGPASVALESRKPAVSAQRVLCLIERPQIDMTYNKIEQIKQQKPQAQPEPVAPITPRDSFHMPITPRGMSFAQPTTPVLRMDDDNQTAAASSSVPVLSPQQMQMLFQQMQQQQSRQ